MQAPRDWQGVTNASFNVGPGFNISNSTIRLEINNKIVMKSIYNVIGTIYGQEEPDRYVLIGSHRDAWLFGAADPSSGTATLPEISRAVAIGKMLKGRWRPRRTVKFCSCGGRGGREALFTWVQTWQLVVVTFSSLRIVHFYHTPSSLGPKKLTKTHMAIKPACTTIWLSETRLKVILESLTLFHIF